MAPKMERTRHPGIYRRGSRYVIVWRHKGRQHKEFFATLAEAREAKAQRQGGERRKRPRLRFRDYAENWIEGYRGRTSRGFSESTRREYRRDVDAHLVPYFGGYLLDDVEPGDVRDWFRWMEDRGASTSATRKAKAALSALFGTAMEDRKVRANPVIGVRYVPSKDVPAPRKLRGLTLAELGRFMEALPSEWRLFFVMLAHTGLRIGELLGRRWLDVHLGDDPHLIVRDQVYRGERKGLKTANAERTLPLSPDMARALADWRERTSFPGSDSPLFPSGAGTPLDYSALYRRVWKPARDTAGIPGVEVGAFHSFRHLLGSLVHASGRKTDRQLCDWLGHADPAFTVREYVGTMDDGLGDAEFLDELIPVEGWATGGQREARSQPQNGSDSAGVSPPDQAANHEQPQRAASPEPAS
ncbi:MAG: site-specific integrase [Actinomycetota bacterium]